MEEKSIICPDHWSEALKAELRAQLSNGRVGQRLVSETDRVRVWSIRLAPGERFGFHRHQLDYFWTAVSPGRSRSNLITGEVIETEYDPGSTRHFAFGPGDFMVHDLTNTGETELVFTTVEFKGGANQPLPL
jgi:quercetin dioxygenase-like cupin family protein